MRLLEVSANPVGVVDARVLATIDLHLPTVVMGDGWGTWIGGIATAAATLIAVYQAVKARQEAAAVRREAIDERRRAQARQVCVWLQTVLADDIGSRVRLDNQSTEPVYQVVIAAIGVDRAGRQIVAKADGSGDHAERPSKVESVIKILPPGGYYLDDGWMESDSGATGIEISFTDNGGIHWRRTVDGALTEISQSPMQYYEQGSPVRYERLRSLH